MAGQLFLGVVDGMIMPRDIPLLSKWAVVSVLDFVIGIYIKEDSMWLMPCQKIMEEAHVS